MTWMAFNSQNISLTVVTTTMQFPILENVRYVQQLAIRDVLHSINVHNVQLKIEINDCIQTKIDKYVNSDMRVLLATPVLLVGHQQDLPATKNIIFYLSTIRYLTLTQFLRFGLILCIYRLARKLNHVPAATVEFIFPRARGFIPDIISVLIVIQVPMMSTIFCTSHLR